VSAALRAGIHYVDVAAEQVSAGQMLEKFDEPARKAGVAVIPSMAFFGGYTDLMTTAALGDWDAVDSIDVMIGFDSWHPTQGTRNTVARERTPYSTIERSLIQGLERKRDSPVQLAEWLRRIFGK